MNSISLVFLFFLLKEMKCMCWTWFKNVEYLIGREMVAWFRCSWKISCLFASFQYPSISVNSSITFHGFFFNKRYQIWKNFLNDDMKFLDYCCSEWYDVRWRWGGVARKWFDLWIECVLFIKWDNKFESISLFFIVCFWYSWGRVKDWLCWNMLRCML